jgi:NitT/TauT family transport system substrate-binding protein
MNSNKLPYLLLTAILFSLGGCDIIANLSGQNEAQLDQSKPLSAPLAFAVAPQIAWIPWYMAERENILQQYSAQHQIQVELIKDNYSDIIDKFIKKEFHAIAISNIDAIAQLVRREIEADVILITNKHNGNEAILLPDKADTSADHLRGKTFALVQYSARHYLFDRYLIRHQIPFNEIKIFDIPEADIPNVLTNKKAYGVVTENPNLYTLTQSGSAKIIFDSRQISNEIFDMIVIHRDVLAKYPQFAQVLLATWFSVMQKLQGSKKGPTLDELANLAGLSRTEYEAQLLTTPLNDTSTKALAAIRDRRIKKTMRHIHYFIQRHSLAGSNEIYSDWISYPGRTPALLHFNGQPLQKFVVPSAPKPS